MIRRALALARASHPEPVVAVTLIAAALAYAAGRGLAFTALCGAAVLSGQLFVGWCNDLIDADLDAAQGRTDKPLATGELSARTARVAAGGALAVCLPLSLAVGVGSAAAHFVAIASATLYNARLKRTVLSVLPYAVAFGLLPAFITLGPPITHLPAWWATAAAALAGAGAHFAQVLADIERDRRRGVMGLPQRLGERASAMIAVGLLAAAVTMVAAGAPSRPVRAAVGVAAVLVAGVLVSALTGRRRAAFRATLAAAVVVVVALLLGGARF